MKLRISGADSYLYTGGKPHDPALPAVVLIHGAGHDHSVWNHQARALAHHGYSVLAPDLPGHGRSEGAPLASIEDLAGWLNDLLVVLDIPRAVLVGHSMGSLIALHTAAHYADRVSRLVLIGSVAPMPVAPALLDAARADRDLAHAMINQWSFAPTTALGQSPTPGFALTLMNRRLMERQAEGVLATDLAACNAYRAGLDAAALVRCPVAMICGDRDQMTPFRATQPLQQALANAPGGARIITIKDAGHATMAEAPDAVTDSIRGFLTQTT